MKGSGCDNDRSREQVGSWRCSFVEFRAVHLVPRVDHPAVGAVNAARFDWKDGRTRGRAFLTISIVTANHGNSVPDPNNLIAAQNSPLARVTY